MTIYLKRGDEAFEISDKIYRLTARREESGGELYDITGLYLFPAFVDTHTHLIGRFLLDLDVQGRRDKEAILKKIEEIDRDPIIVYGRDEELLGEEITPEDLDAFDKRILAIRVDGHVGVVNKKLAEEFSLEKRYLYEDDLYKVLQELKKQKPREPAVKKALEEMKRRGVIHVGEISKDLFTIRVAAELGFPAEFLLEALDEAEDARGMVKRLKVYADGSLGARTAALRDPYRDDPGNHGKLLLEASEIEELALKAEKLGMGLAIHAIGDRAIDEVLDGLKKTNAKRHRIEHFELAREDQVAEAAKLGVWISLQPNFVYNRGGLNGLYRKRLGPERLMRIMPLDELLAYRARIAFGSDCMPFDPIIGLIGATRHPFHPISLEDSIRLYTLEAAKLLGIDYKRPAVVVMNEKHESVLRYYNNKLETSLKREDKKLLGAKHELSPEEFIRLIASKLPELRRFFNPLL